MSLYAGFMEGEIGANILTFIKFIDILPCKDGNLGFSLISYMGSLSHIACRTEKWMKK